MSKKEEIRKDLVTAMKAKDEIGTSTRRLLLAAIEKREKAGSSPVELSDTEVISILNKEVAARKEMVDVYKKAGRLEQSEKELSEINVISEYLPQALSRNEVEKIVADTIARNNASSMRDMGVVMREVTAEVAGRFDGKTISEIVKSKLS